jgi:hypothetical protein
MHRDRPTTTLMNTSYRSVMVSSPRGARILMRGVAEDGIGRGNAGAPSHVSCNARNSGEFDDVWYSIKTMATASMLPETRERMS